MTMSELIALMSGIWSGNETIVMGPDANLSASGEFETCSTLNGSGCRSSYRQMVSGSPGMVCETLYRFGPDDAVTMVWLPGEGEPQIFQGTRKGAVLSVSTVSAEGLKQVQIADYSKPDQLQSRMLITFPDGSESEVFSACYERNQA